jgi:hypothetical protein
LSCIYPWWAWVHDTTQEDPGSQMRLKISGWEQGAWVLSAWFSHVCLMLHLPIFKAPKTPRLRSICSSILHYKSSWQLQDDIFSLHSDSKKQSAVPWNVTESCNKLEM